MSAELWRIIEDRIQELLVGTGPVSPKEFERLMNVIWDNGGIVASHVAADNLMCAVLRRAGYGDGAWRFLNEEKHHE